MSCYNSTVPDSPPREVFVTSIDPASLMITWRAPALGGRNGHILGYVIQYTRVETSNMMSVNVNSGTTQYTISGLVPFVIYSVIVAAVNVNGTGIFSNSIIQVSGGDSELN